MKIIKEKPKYNWLNDKIKDEKFINTFEKIDNRLKLILKK